jgi:hypothetical protein
MAFKSLWLSLMIGVARLSAPQMALESLWSLLRSSMIGVMSLSALRMTPFRLIRDKCSNQFCCQVCIGRSTSYAEKMSYNRPPKT